MKNSVAEERVVEAVVAVETVAATKVLDVVEIVNSSRTIAKEAEREVVSSETKVTSPLCELIRDACYP